MALNMPVAGVAHDRSVREWVGDFSRIGSSQTLEVESSSRALYAIKVVANFFALRMNCRQVGL